MQLRTIKSQGVAGIAIAEFLLLLCVLMTCGDVLAADRQFIWQGREQQFVALEQQDPISGGPAPLNDHPANISRERIITFLGALDLRPPGNEKPVPLFTKATLDTLAPQLHQGLLTASPGEDVTFAVIGLHSALFGLAKQPKVTTGRLFYQHGRINLIVGLAQKDVNDRDDRRLSPFTPGSRQAVTGEEWAILPAEGQKDIIQTRKDWVVSTEDVGAPANPPPPAVNPVAPAVSRSETFHSRSDSSRTPEERLIIINELKGKGLISEKEYQDKRKEILNGL